MVLKIPFSIFPIIVTIFLLVNCRSLEIIEQEDPIFSIQKTPCYGTCPVFELKIYSNGIALLRAEEYTKIKGNYYAKIDRKKLRGLKDAFQQSLFFEFKDNYDGQMSDLPTTIISYDDGQHKKIIRDYFGAPQKLKDLERMLENLLNEEEWTKREDAK